MSTLVQDALTAAERRLKIFKRAAQDGKEFGWELHPEEFWEPADDDALELIERAQAQERGERPLFKEAI